MRYLPRRRLLQAGLAMLLSLSLFTTVFAAEPDGSSAENAKPLSGTVSGALTGSSGGSYSYYTFYYPGDKQPAQLSFDFTPNDTTIASGIGFNIYQGDVKVADHNGISPTPGHLPLAFWSANKGPMILQVYNFLPGTTVNYSFGLSGISTVAPAAPAASAAPTPPVGKAPENPAPASNTVSGTLKSSYTGSFEFYTYNHPGGGANLAVTITFSPSGAETSNALFFYAYKDGQQVGSAQGSKLDPPGTVTFNIKSDTAGPVLVQIGNYNFSRTIS